MSINSLTNTNYNVGQDTDWSITSLSTTIPWSSICCSANGQYVAACGSNSKIWISSDYGVTWTEKNTAYPNKNWSCICMSSTGKYIYANENTTSYIWKSSDYGNTFQTTATIQSNFIVCSYDGKYVITFFSGTDYIYVSNNFGASYSQRGIRANWYRASISENGQYMVAYVYNNTIYYSIDYGSTWYSTSSGLNKNFSGITISSNGSIAYACVLGEYIYKSSDNGITWSVIKNDASYNWGHISCSSSGKYITASIYGDSIVNLNYTGGNIWISSDFGATWINSTSTFSNKNWSSSIMSSSGQYLYSFTGNILTTNGTIGVYKSTQSVELGDFYYSPPDYYSTNYRIPDSDSISTTTAPSSNWSKIAMSTDAQYLIACRYDANRIYYSNDTGNTWSVSNSSPIGYWYDCAMSYNGQFAIACQTSVNSGQTDGNVFFSSDFGVTWTNQNSKIGAKSWGSVSISSNGKILLAGANTSNLYISKDYASTWNNYSPNIFWNGLTISYDSKFFYGCNGNNGNVYSSTDGITWTAFSGIFSRNYNRITCSFNGQYIATSVPGGYIYVSSDYGQTWSAKMTDANRNWYDIAYSYSGKYGVSCILNGNIYTSSDYGDTWLDIGLFSGTKAWSRITISATGKYIFATEQGTGKIYKCSFTQDIGNYIGCPPGNYNYGYNTIQKKYVFKEKNAGAPFYSVACSNTGQYVVCIVRNFNIYTSNDYGQTFTQQTNSPIKDWGSVACSSTGQYMVAAERTSNAGYIYTSSDYGVTWTQRTNSGQRNWVSICCSGDGSNIFAAVIGSGYIYYSSDYGANWSQKASLLNWYTIACSSDGTKIIAAVGGGQLYISTDTGSTWSAKDSNRNWKFVACSGNGTYMLASVNVATNTSSPNNYDNYIYVSNNSGTTWTKKGIFGTWNGVSCSNDGSVMMALSSKIYISTDFGNTWVETGPNRDWWSAVVSNDSNYLFCTENTLGSVFIANSSSTNQNSTIEILTNRQ